MSRKAVSSLSMEGFKDQLDNDFLKIIKRKRHKGKNKQMGSHQNKKFLHS